MSPQVQRLARVTEAREVLSSQPGVVLATLGLALVVASVAGLVVGAMPVPLTDVLEVLRAHVLPGGVVVDSVQDAVVWQIRVPRILLGALVGAALASAGATFQGLFRNPLADPGLLGVTMGAAAAVALCVLGASTLGPILASAPVLEGLRPFLVPISAFLGSLLTLVFVLSLSGGAGRMDVATVLLAGIAVNAICGALTGVAIYLADDAQLRDLSFWSLGGLGGATWPVVLVCGPVLLAGLSLMPYLARDLDCLLLGEAEAQHLGVDVERAKRRIVGLGALLVGVSVSVSGAIGFVGLVVPHLVRMAVGPGHRLLLPASALLGGAVLVLADVLARTVVAPSELPIGVVTTLLGGPFFLGLLLARRRHS